MSIWNDIGKAVLGGVAKELTKAATGDLFKSVLQQQMASNKAASSNDAHAEALHQLEVEREKRVAKMFHLDRPNSEFGGIPS
jgi:ribosomal protein RSM22 (predicted rRNA methylase)